MKLARPRVFFRGAPSIFTRKLRLRKMVESGREPVSIHAFETEIFKAARIGT